MQLELTNKQFRRLLDLVYIGNWILNSTTGRPALRGLRRGREPCSSARPWSGGHARPGRGVSRARSSPPAPLSEGGIHEAIMEYENNVFFDILAEDLARRDMDDVPIDESNFATSWPSRIDDLHHRVRGARHRQHPGGPGHHHLTPPKTGGISP